MRIVRTIVRTIANVQPAITIAVITALMTAMLATGCGDSGGDTTINNYNNSNDTPQVEEDSNIVSQQKLDSSYNYYPNYAVSAYTAGSYQLPEFAGEYNDSKGANDNSTSYESEAWFRVEHHYGTKGDYMGPLLSFQESPQLAYTWELWFDEPVEYSLQETQEDLAGTSISIPVAGYHVENIITSASRNIGEITYLTLMRSTKGFNPVFLESGVTYYFYQASQCQNSCAGGAAEVTVEPLPSSGSCSVSVNTDTVNISEGSMEKAGSISVGVTETISNACQVILHAEEVQFSKDGQPLKRNSEEVEGTVSYIDSYTSGNGYLEVFGYGAEDPAGGEALKPGQAVTCPVNGFNWTYNGIYNQSETVEWNASAGLGEVSLTNKDSRRVDIPMYGTGSGIVIGEPDHPLLSDQTFCPACAQTVEAASLQDFEGVLVAAMDSSGALNILELSSIAEGSSITADVKNLTTGEAHEVVWNAFSDGSMEISGIGTINLPVSYDTNYTLAAAYTNLSTFNYIPTLYDGAFDLSLPSRSLQVDFEDAGGNYFGYIISEDSDDEELYASAWIWDSGTKHVLDDTTSVVNFLGNVMTYDTDSKNRVNITNHDTGSAGGPVSPVSGVVEFSLSLPE